jgi:hypothetical protein
VLASSAVGDGGIGDGTGKIYDSKGKLIRNQGELFDSTLHFIGFGRAWGGGEYGDCAAIAETIQSQRC